MCPLVSASGVIQWLLLVHGKMDIKRCIGVAFHSHTDIITSILDLEVSAVKIVHILLAAVGGSWRGAKGGQCPCGNNAPGGSSSKIDMTIILTMIVFVTYSNSLISFFTATSSRVSVKFVYFSWPLSSAAFHLLE